MENCVICKEPLKTIMKLYNSNREGVIASTRQLLPRNSDIHNYNSRGRRNIHLNRISSKSGIRSFLYAAANFFNKLPSSVKNSKSIRSFTSN